MDRENCNYWIFQANPDYYEIEKAIINNDVYTWEVNQHGKLIKEGDEFIFYIGKNKGIVAKGIIKSNPTEMEDNQREKKYQFDKTKSGIKLRVRIEITNSWIDNPITKEEIENKNNLSDFHIGNPGTNKKLSKEHYFELLKMRLNENIEDEKMNEKIRNITRSDKRNFIFYGPPGTGKTFCLKEIALSIIDGNKKVDNNNRQEINRRYNELIDSGQIEFITFHQSYSYEEFIQGIKASTNGENVSYSVEDGVFKRISDLARMNLEESSSDEKEKKPFDSKYIDNLIEKYAHNIQKLLSEDQNIQFFNNMKYNEVKIKSSGKISFLISTGGTPQGLASDLIKKLYPKYISGEIMSSEDIKPTRESKREAHGLAIYYYEILKRISEYEKTLKDGELKLQSNSEKKNYVIIIDEINRGNISKIFGELISLIEEDKRIRDGNDKQLTVTLPYSAEDEEELFGIPDNLYIIGTMNTADRSIALMDTALRRRFTFIEMMPQPELLDKVVINGVNLCKMLTAMNERIEYLYDRDHTIGHAYFMELLDNTLFDDEKAEKKAEKGIYTFRNKIIPLLQEYFYDDWDKIRMVLGDNRIKEKKYQFIIEKDKNYEKLFGEKNGNHYLEEKKLYEINEGAFHQANSYIKIYDTKAVTAKDGDVE